MLPQKIDVRHAYLYNCIGNLRAKEKISMRKKGIFAIVLAILSLSLVACANDTSKDNDRADDVNIEAEAEDTSNEAVTDGGNEENTSGKVQENISERVEAVVKEPYNPKYELAMGLAYTVNADGTSCTITGIGTCELTEF